MSWWDIGEGHGYQSTQDRLRFDLVICGFCNESGKFVVQHHVKKQNSSGKVLNYDILTCEQCGNFTAVFWGIGRSGLQNFHQVPWPRQTVKWPDHWPSDVGRYWLQAKRSVEVHNWDAAALMARSAVQLVMRHQNAVGRTLNDEINDLKHKGVLPPIMLEWAHEVRVLGNDNAHPAIGADGTSDQDARSVVEYLSVLMKIVFDLPHQISEHRTRKSV